MLAIFSSLIPALLCIVLCTNEAHGSSVHWSPCLDQCPSLLSNRSCPVVNGTCKCQWTNESNFCDPVDQRLLTNLTGSWQKNATDCCYCNSSQRYCCQRCNSTAQITTAAPTTATTVPSDYFRLLIMFVLDCTKYNSQPESNFTESFIAAMSDIANVNSAFIVVHDRSCVNGNMPYCGVDVDEIRAHHRARRLAGGRARSGGGGKKSGDDDDKNDNNYSNNNRGTYVVTKCGGFAVNLTVYANQNVLESLRKRVVNDSMVLSMWNGDIFAAFVLSAAKGDSYKLHEAPMPPPLKKAPLEIPPLETNLKPMMMGFGASVFLVFLFLLYRCIKHSVMLRMHKFTDINSDEVKQKTPPPVEVVKTEEQKKEEEEEEAKAKERKEKERLGPSYDMTHTSIPYVTNDAVRRYDWTSPGYLPSMLAPVPRTNGQNGQSRARLILDDIESDDENCSADSDANVDEDKILCDELNSDDESSSAGESDPRSNVPQIPPPRSVSSLYRKHATPVRSTTRQEGAGSTLDVARPATAQSACDDGRPGSAQSRRVPTPAPEVREETDLTDADRTASEAGRPPTPRSPSAVQRPSSAQSRNVLTPAPEVREECDLTDADRTVSEAGRPSTPRSPSAVQRPGSAQSRNVPTPAPEVREECDLTDADRTASEAGRPSTSRNPSAVQRPSSVLSVDPAIPTPAMEEDAASVEDLDPANQSSTQPERPPTAPSVNEEQRPRSALSSSRMNQASPLPPVC